MPVAIIRPVVPKLPTLALPVPVFNVPATLTPVLVTTKTLATPFDEILTLPAAAGMLTFELPFARAPVNVVAVIVFDAKLAVIPVTMFSALLPFEDDVTPAKYTVEEVEVLV